MEGTTRSGPQRLVALLASLLLIASCASDTGGDQGSGPNELPTPEVGETRLAYLDDGTPIWLVHPDAGDPIAVAALAAAGPELSSQLGDVDVSVTWNEVREQFVAGSVWDATGRAIGFVRDEMSAEEERRVRDLDQFEVERGDDGRLIVGARQQGERRIVHPLPGVDAAEGSDPSTLRRIEIRSLPVPVVDEVADLEQVDGLVGLTVPVVGDGAGPVSVCAQAFRRGLAPCPAGSPAIAGARMPLRYESQITAWTGPFLVMVDAGRLSELVLLGGGNVGEEREP